jgi:hypothetical protein
MASRTVYLSRLLGLLALLVSAAMLLHKQSSVEAATALIHSLPLSLVTGLIVLICGLAMVLGHNRWSGGALPVVVTLFGWSFLIRGALLLFLAPDDRISLFQMLQLEKRFPLYVAINLILGAYLTYAGFKAPLVRSGADVAP